MARTDGLFEIRQTGYVSPIDGASLWLRGTDNYINFGLTPGVSGYGFRDNAGVMEFKDASGAWAPLGSGGSVAETFETVSKNLKSYDYTINYNGSGDVSTIVYSVGITKTLNYSSGNVTSIVLSGSTPSGIDLTKTLTYDVGDNVEEITYS